MISVHKSVAVFVLILSLCIPSTALAFTVTSPFGWRQHPISGEWKFHSGVDLAAEEGEPIPALWDGQVVYADWYEGYGLCVVLAHANNTYTLYGHCSTLYVRPGDTVKQGQAIAAVGSTGESTGPHLHLSLIVNQEWVDPLPVLH